MKGRKTQNQIRTLATEGGTILKTADSIEAEIVGYYKRLLGSSTQELHAINPGVMQGGSMLSRSQQLQLIAPFTRENVSQALNGIDDSKAPSRDGFNSRLFKKSWNVLGDEVTDAVKGYGRRGISPRYMVKIDMQKAYDSIEWVFLEQVLSGLNFLEKFVKWIMSCISTVTYSIIINGSPTPPFTAKRGIRQGDLMSPFLFVLAMEYLTRLLRTLKSKPNFNYHPMCEKLRIANQSKSCAYFGGVPEGVQQDILQTLGFSRGNLPFRYLGIFPLPKKIIKRLRQYVKSFYGQEKLKAAIVKHLWNLHKKKDRLWIQWVHTYYIQRRQVWSVNAKQASWLIQKIIQVAKYLNEAALNIEQELNTEKYSIRDVYNKLRGDFPKISWKRKGTAEYLTRRKGEWKTSHD
uniref:Reverse transcriptase domain-containing protein n=1 Tax=Nicotiana tabacum TaxID=4097 RepID=A0A1S3XWM5_TOBAC|nr:PREDICTED: uncharacterized protein LOC107769412 [Nicotiana tabacum]